MTLLKQDPSAQRPCAKTMLGLPGMGHLQVEHVARSRPVAKAGPYAARAGCRRTLRSADGLPAPRSLLRRKRTNQEAGEMKILMVLTSHDRLGNTGRKTGFWLEELA